MKDPRTHDVASSYALWERANRIIPGGSQLISRRPYAFSNGFAPVYAQRGKGSRIWDDQGVEYVDYGMSVTSAILGYADDVVDNAVIEQIGKGATYSLNSEREIELAELLIERIPCADMARFSKGGGESCTIAVRIARGATGRDVVLFSGYHGWHDWYLAAGHHKGGRFRSLRPAEHPARPGYRKRWKAPPFRSRGASWSRWSGCLSSIAARWPAS